MRMRAHHSDHSVTPLDAGAALGPSVSSHTSTVLMVTLCCTRPSRKNAARAAARAVAWACGRQLANANTVASPTRMVTTATMNRDGAAHQSGNVVVTVTTGKPDTPGRGTNAVAQAPLSAATAAKSDKCTVAHSACSVPLPSPANWKPTTTAPSPAHEPRRADQNTHWKPNTSVDAGIGIVITAGDAALVTAIGAPSAEYNSTVVTGAVTFTDASDHENGLTDHDTTCVSTVVFVDTGPGTALLSAGNDTLLLEPAANVGDDPAEFRESVTVNVAL